MSLSTTSVFHESKPHKPGPRYLLSPQNLCIYAYIDVE